MIMKTFYKYKGRDISYLKHLDKNIYRFFSNDIRTSSKLLYDSETIKIFSIYGASNLHLDIQQIHNKLNNNTLYCYGIFVNNNKVDDGLANIVYRYIPGANVQYCSRFIYNIPLNKNLAYIITIDLKPAVEQDKFIAPQEINFNYKIS